MSKKLWIVPVVVVAAGAGVSYWLPGQYIDQGFKQLEGGAAGMFDVTINQPSGNEFDVKLKSTDIEFPLVLNVKNTVKKSVWQSTVTHEFFVDDATLGELSGEFKNWVQQNLIDQPVMTGTTTVDVLGN
jgi:hypothetical protein